MPVPADVVKVAKKWAGQDPDPETKAELKGLLARAEAGDEDAAAEINDAFAGPLEFGTAGLRGRLGPGPGRMNRVTVIHAAEGVGAYLRQKAQFGAVLIGYDARHKSAEFAHEAAEVIGGVGHRPIVLDHPAPTPLVAFGIRELDCIAGIVVTASHNPPADNGFKVYLDDGRQIVPPADETISHGMHRSAGRPLFMLQRSTDYRRLDDELESAYLDRITRVVGTSGPREISWVYTPLHGVGRSLVERTVDRLGLPAPAVVAEQADPDPDFPTVAFPNPEEPGAMDLAFALATERGADLIVANDPDADRCAVGIPDGTGWRMLHGDEVGALLGDFLARRGATGTFVNTIVSGSMLGRIAETHGLPSARTLTGFKWITRVPGIAFGYEEALGYCCDPESVADKDGISALALVLTLAAEEKAAGRTLADRLDDLALAHGVHVSDQLSMRVEDLTLISGAMARLRAEAPAELCGEPVEFIDLAEGWGDLPPTEAVRLAGETITVTVRPSGTEPKLKCYLEARVAPEVTRRDLPGSRAESRGMIDRLRAEVQQAIGL